MNDTQITTTQAASISEVEAQTRNWAMALHFSQFLGYAIPLLGFAAPIAIWQIKKDQLPGIDKHGAIVANWLVSSLIYWAISAFFMLILVGFAMLYIMGALCIIFPLIGGIKASQGETWNYPGSIRFFG